MSLPLPCSFCAALHLIRLRSTAETFKDGWLLTGDEVKINARKEVFVVDRIKELIKVRGFQVAPSELEGHLLNHADVADACVVGVPDEYSGELPLAFVVPSPAARTRMRMDTGLADAVRMGIMEVRLGLTKERKRS